MDSTDIQIFLTVMQTGNFVAAAQASNLTQSTLSKRIKKLEDELGAPLFHRGKGVKNVELSPAGLEFVDLAQRWQGLWQDMSNLRHNQGSPQLRVGVLDSMQPLTVRLTQRLFERDPDLSLRILARPSRVMYLDLDRCDIDVGFSHQESRMSSVQRQLLISEPFVVLGAADYLPPGQETARTADLDPDCEVFTEWSSPGYMAWHENTWPRHLSRRLSVSSVHLQLAFLGTGDNKWSIMPYSFAANLPSTKPLVMCRLEPEPPPRICFLLTRKQPRAGIKESLRDYIELLHDTIRNEEPWMRASAPRGRGSRTVAP